VFRSIDPFDAPLREAIGSRAILFPVAYLLDRPQFDAVVTAASLVGDHGICLSITEEFSGDSGAGASHWVLNRWDWHEYRDIGRAGVLENALYSPEGTWGILVSHEQHAVVGGSEPFLKALAAEFPGFRESRVEFLRFWYDLRDRRATDVSWLPELLAHVYGAAPGAGETEWPDGQDAG
jgi:hypothetical protein